MPFKHSQSYAEIIRYMIYIKPRAPNDELIVEMLESDKRFGKDETALNNSSIT